MAITPPSQCVQIRGNLSGGGRQVAHESIAQRAQGIPITTASGRRACKFICGLRGFGGVFSVSPARFGYFMKSRGSARALHVRTYQGHHRSPMGWNCEERKTPHMPATKV